MDLDVFRKNLNLLIILVVIFEFITTTPASEEETNIQENVNKLKKR